MINLEGRLNLTRMAVELLCIHQEFLYHLDDPMHHGEADFDLYVHTQVWGNTSGGFEGMGGCSMTTQRVWVFVPLEGVSEMCQVYFGGAFGYKVKRSEVFMKDVLAGSVAGKRHRGRYVE